MKHPKQLITDTETSKRMANVKLKHGDAEVLLAKVLWHKGYRYHLNDKRLPGSPDIAILKHHIAVFVDGEFWHGFDWNHKKIQLNRNREYWIEKIEENIARDARVGHELIAIGWTPIRFWTKEVLNNPNECVEIIEEYILQNMVDSQPSDYFDIDSL